MAIPKHNAICHMFVLNAAVHTTQQIVGNPETLQPDAPFAGAVTPQTAEVVITSGSWPKATTDMSRTVMLPHRCTQPNATRQIYSTMKWFNPKAMLKLRRLIFPRQKTIRASPITFFEDPPTQKTIQM
jgi:hypothetical protein